MHTIGWQLGSRSVSIEADKRRTNRRLSERIGFNVPINTVPVVLKCDDRAYR